MVWKRIKNLFGAEAQGPGATPTPAEPTPPAASSQAPKDSAANSGQQLPAIPLIAAEANPWGIPLFDVRPVTLGMRSTSRDPQCAANAISFGREDGRIFIGQQPQGPREVPLDLDFPIDRMLADGVLFAPREMEHKWAIFVYGSQIILVPSWTRSVAAVADFERGQGRIRVTRLHGSIAQSEESPAFSARLLDYLLRTHALGLPYPTPLPPEFADQPQPAALWCMNLFGNLARVATAHDLVRQPPEIPLRSQSLLHIAAARGDLPGIEAALTSGVPIDLPAGDGLTALHWALARQDFRPAFDLLLRHGCPIDARSVEGATSLMNAVQSASTERVALLLERGADINARDLRGFTALHRATEMGHVDVARLLLQHGAAVDVEAGGFTPRALAEKHKRVEILALLDGTS